MPILVSCLQYWLEHLHFLLTLIWTVFMILLLEYTYILYGNYLIHHASGLCAARRHVVTEHAPLSQTGTVMTHLPTPVERLDKGLHRTETVCLSAALLFFLASECMDMCVSQQQILLYLHQPSTSFSAEFCDLLAISKKRLLKLQYIHK